MPPEATFKQWGLKVGDDGEVINDFSEGLQQDRVLLFPEVTSSVTPLLVLPPSPTHSPHSVTAASWGHLTHKPPPLTFLSQAPMLEELTEFALKCSSVYALPLPQSPPLRAH